MTSMFLFSLILPQTELTLLLKLTLCGKRLLRFCADPNGLKLLLYSAHILDRLKLPV